MTPPKKRKFDRRKAIAAAKEIVDEIMPACERICVAGSLRRRKLFVGDIELVFVAKMVEQKSDLFTTESVSAVDQIIEALITKGVIAKRLNSNGSPTWGPRNKLALHCKSGIPVDFFSTKIECWPNYLCCRTGGARNNQLIAEAYQRLGMKWHPYSIGYSDKTGTEHANTSEAAVYENAGLKYLHPWLRP